MAKYMEVAGQANEVALSLMKMVQSDKESQAAELIARLVNLGVRCSPRGVQHTVRLNSVRRAVEGLPVRVSMRLVKNPKTGFTYNALVTEPVGGTVNVEGECED